MSDEISRQNIVQKILPKANNLICNNLDPEPLLGIMLEKGALTFDDVTTIRDIRLVSGKSKELVKILMSSPATSYDVFMDGLLQIAIPRRDIYEAIVKIEREFGYTRPGVDAAPLTSTPEEPEWPAKSDGAQQLSQDDMYKISYKAGLTKEQMNALYLELGIRQDQIDSGKDSANTNDYKLQSFHILNGQWLQEKASAATRQVIIKALKEIGANKAALFLEKVWGIVQ